MIVTPAAMDHLDNEQNNFSNELREPELEMFETSPKFLPQLQTVIDQPELCHST